jgi:PKD repeat protein/pimeloyl-ACP methyl ester carboxylesterase
MRKLLFSLTLFIVLFSRVAFGAFVVNGNGTVTDTSTGLIWQRETAGEMTWEAAISYCEGLSLGGYSDWRLPNRNDLLSLVDYTRYDPAIDTTAFPDTMSSYYWSSTTYAPYSVYAWCVYFDYGLVSHDLRSYDSYVRAVRSGQCGALGDLVIDNLWLSCYGGDVETQTVSSEKLTISASVQAKGTEAMNVKVVFYEEDTVNNPGTWTRIGDPEVIAHIAGDSNQSTYITWTPAQKKHRIKVVIDPNDTIQEADETNNERIIEFNEEAVPLHTEYEVVDSKGNIKGTDENLSGYAKAHFEASNSVTGKKETCDTAPKYFIPASFMTPENARISYSIDLYLNDGTHRRLPTRFLKVYRIPVIFIPGIFGTKLFGLSLPLSLVGVNVVELTGGDPVKIEGALGALGLKMELLDVPAFGFSYSPLIDKLQESGGYVMDETLFEFPYNWFMPVKFNGNLLSAKIQEIKDKTPVGKVDLIAHSMGGLVARSFIQLNQHYQNEVNKLITIETPHHGSPMAYPMLESNLPFPEGTYSFLFDACILPMANKKNNEPSFNPFSEESNHRVINSEKLHTYLNVDFGGLRDLLSDGSSYYLREVGSGQLVAGPANNFLENLNQNVNLEAKGVHYKNIVGIGIDTPDILSVRQKGSSYWYPDPLASTPANAWIDELFWNPADYPFNLVYNWTSWMIQEYANPDIRWRNWLDWQWEHGVFLKTWANGVGDGTVTIDSLMPRFFMGKDRFGNEITEVVDCIQNGKKYAHDKLPSSPEVMQKMLDYLLGESYQNPLRARSLGIETAESALEKEMMIFWASTADLTIVDPAGRVARIRPGSGVIENTIPGFFCFSLTDHSALLSLGNVADGSYEFQISGPAGTSYKLDIKHSVNSFDAGENSFSGVIPQGGQTVTYQITPANNQPMPLFTISPNPASCNQPITFDASNSYHLSAGHTITEYAWDWTSDGIYDDFGVRVSHVFPDDGSYIVTLRVTDDNKPPKSMTLQMALTVTKDFKADFKAMSTLGQAPFTVAFQDLSVGAQTWSWDFDNDGVEDSQEQNPSYQYDVPGTYTVRLTITRNGQADTKVIEGYIKVTENLIGSGCPTVKANGPYSGEAGVPVFFSSLGSIDPDGDVLTYFWNFGDGTISNEANPSHIYTKEGTYTGTLTVDDGTCMVDESFQVQIEASSLVEVCDGIDNDSDGVIDNGFDVGQACTAGTGACEASGVKVCSADANTTVCNATPGTPSAEVCDGIDNDCDGLIDEEGAEGCTTYYKDADRDGYGIDGNTKCLCKPTDPNTATKGGDCDDTDARINPDATEICDNKDNDCDGLVDENLTQTCTTACGSGTETCQGGQWVDCNAPAVNTYYQDADGDGYGNPSMSNQACSAPAGYVADNTDCNDADKNMYPGAPELPCNCIDSISLGETKSGSWSSDCTSKHRAGRYAYAYYYTFTLTSDTIVQIDLKSEGNTVDTYLYLLSGTGTGGSVITSDDDAGEGTNSRISKKLTSGTYTLEATTYYSDRIGTFTLSLNWASFTTIDVDAFSLWVDTGIAISK